MRIEKLSLRGFLRFRDTLTIDLASLPPGLIALVGENGSGKTTLLEAAPAALYRTWLSRGDLIDYATDRDSFLEVQLATDGTGVYRARVNVDGVKRTSDAILEQIHADGTRAILNDGKVSTFDGVVAEHFPAKDLLLASAFAAQNKAGSFLTLDKKGRKELFLQLLGLERYQTMSETARQAAALTEQARTRLVAQRDLLRRDTREEIAQELERIFAQLQRQGDDAAIQQRHLQEQIASLDARLAAIADQVAAYAAARLRIQTIETELTTRRSEGQATTADQARTKAACVTDCARIEQRRDAAVAEIDTLVANNQKLLANADRVRAAVTALDTAQGALTDLRARERQVDDALQAAVTSAERCDRQLTAFAQTRRDLDRVKADAETLRTVPFGDRCGDAGCRFLVNAQHAQAQIEPLTLALAGKGDVERDREAFTVRATEYKTRLTDIRTAIQQHERTITQHRPEAALAPKLEAATARIEELQMRRLETLRRAIEDINDTRARRDRRLGEIQTQQDAIHARLDALVTELAQATDDLAGSAEGHRSALSLEGALAECRRDWDQTVRTLAMVDSGRHDLARRRTELEAKRATIADLTTRLARLETDLVEWQTLAKAFGRDGLPVLEMDAAGPTIASYCNTLLAESYGPRFTVDLLTQELKTSGKGLKETFTISVLDNAHAGQARDIADLSGGEQVIVAEALANAIAIDVNTRSPMPVRTCWRDETTGALDPENARRYLAMLRKVQELGGFHHVLFITHNPDAAAQADAQIRLADGHVTVLQPPYAEAA